MIIYCLGTRAAVIAAMKERGVHIVADDEVLWTARDDEGERYVVGPIPFGRLTGGEYIGYRRALRGVSPADRRGTEEMCARFLPRLDPKRRIDRLGLIGYRALTFLADAGESAESVCFMLNDLPFSPRNARHMSELLTAAEKHRATCPPQKHSDICLPEKTSAVSSPETPSNISPSEKHFPVCATEKRPVVYVSVADHGFVPTDANVLVFGADGEQGAAVISRFTSERRAAKKSGAVAPYGLRALEPRYVVVARCGAVAAGRERKLLTKADG